MKPPVNTCVNVTFQVEIQSSTEEAAQVTTEKNDVADADRCDDDAQMHKTDSNQCKYFTFFIRYRSPISKLFHVV